MIIFKKIRYKNFLSVGNNWVEINLDSHKKTLISARNGSGKSILCDVLDFALFGKPFRKINKNAIVNSINKSALEVEISFNINNKNYFIKRGIKPNIFEIYENNVLIEQNSMSQDYQEYLEKNILKTTYKSFNQVVILGSARYIPFMQLTAADRRIIIEDILDIQIFSIMGVIVKNKLELLIKDITKIKYDISLMKDKITLQENVIYNNRSKSKSEIDNKKNDINQYKQNIELCKGNIEKLKDELDVITEQLKEKSDLEKKKNEFIGYKTKIQTSITSFSKSINFYKDNNSCPTCQQTIDENFRQDKLITLTNKYDEYNGNYTKVIKRLEIYNNKLLELNDLLKTSNRLQNEIVKLQTTITNYSDSIIKINDEIETINDNKNDNYETDLLKFKETLQNYIDVQEKLTDDKKYIDCCSLLLKDGGIKTKIIKQYLPILNKLINSYLERFDFFIKFNIDESFDETIKSRNRDVMSYSNFSEGEKLRIDLSLLFAFRDIAKLKNSVNCNIIIFDEILDGSIDDFGQQKFLDLLDNLEDNISIFVISHRTDDIKERFDRILEFEKVKNFTRIKDNDENT